MSILGNIVVYKYTKIIQFIIFKWLAVVRYLYTYNGNICI